MVACYAASPEIKGALALDLPRAHISCMPWRRWQRHGICIIHATLPHAMPCHVMSITCHGCSCHAMS